MIDLGKIAATITLNLAELTTQSALAKAMIGELGESMQAKAGALAQDVGSKMALVGAAIVGALGEAVKVGADFDSKMIEVANNTTMTSTEIAQMTEQVKTLGKESGASMSQLAEGAMHISNFGFSAAQSTQILNEAMKSAVSTGGDVGKTAEILANVMHEFSIKTEDAGKAMNVLHLAAAQGNMTLEQLVEAGGPAFAMAANLGVSLNETAAAMSALTKHGFTAAEAATQVRNILSHLAEPASKTKDLLEQLSHVTGIDLVRDFTLAGLKAKGMAGILDDVKEAARRAHLDVSDLMMKLVPAMRGGIGAMALAGTAASDFREELLRLSEAMSGKVDPTTQAYNRQQATLTAQTNKARNEMVLMADDIQKALLPAIQPLINDVRSLAQWFQSLSPEVKKNVAEFALLSGGLLLVGGSALKLIGSLASLRAALIAINGASATASAGLSGFGGAIRAGVLGPVGAAVAALGVLAGALYAIHKTLDSAREAGNQAAWTAGEARYNPATYLAPKGYEKAGIAGLQKMIAADKAKLSGYAYSPSALADAKKELEAKQAALTKMMFEHGGTVSQGADFDGPKVPAGVTGIKSMSEFMDGGGGGGGGRKGGGSSAADRLEELKQKADEAKQALQRVRDELFALTHNKFDTERREAQADYLQNLKDGVPQGDALALVRAKNAKINAEEQKFWDDQVGIASRGLGQAFSAMSAGFAKIEELRVKQAEDAKRLAEEQWRGEIETIIESQTAEQAELQQTQQYWNDVADEAEKAFRAEIEGSILAAKAERDEAEATQKYWDENPLKKKGFDFKPVLLSMRDSLQSILGGAFEKLFTGDTKNLFKSMLQSFEQMLAQMAARALAAGIIRSLLGGGNFLTGFVGALTGGFDDAGNDRTAKHWGYDFASFFTRGAQDFMHQGLATGSGGRAAGNVSMTVNFDNVHVHNGLDVRQVGEQIAWHAQERLRAQVGT